MISDDIPKIGCFECHEAISFSMFANVCNMHMFRACAKCRQLPCLSVHTTGTRLEVDTAIVHCPT